MEGEPKLCQYCYRDLTSATTPDPRLALPLRRFWWALKRYVWYSSNIGPVKFALGLTRSKLVGKAAHKRKRKSHKVKGRGEALNLQPGEWVEVRSLKEIFATLDEEGRLRGLRFIPEMAKFCGGRFRVYKKLEKIIMESTGELRRIKTPTVLLEGVFCDGKAHGGCDRACFCFWREVWLKRIPLETSAEKI